MNTHATNTVKFRAKLLAILLASGITAGSVAIDLATGTPVSAQSSQTGGAPLPSFEVASIKLSSPESNGRRIGGPAPDRFIATNATARDIIAFGYHLIDLQLSGGPSWVNAEYFDIDAKIDDAIAQRLQNASWDEQTDEKRLMVQSLLAERFHLTVRHEFKELPSYTLEIGKGGSKLRPTIFPKIGPDGKPIGAVPPGLRPGVTLQSPDDQSWILTATAIPMSTFLRILSGQLGRVIVDNTGIRGEYDFQLKWTPENLTVSSPGALAGSALSDPSAPSIVVAMRDQLGLKLESRKGPVDTVVITHIEKPSGN
jgi:uncharacterized protein (TIGR03435 family)